MFTEKEMANYVRGPERLPERKHFSVNEARHVGDQLGIRWDTFGVEEFALGLNVELEHGTRNPETDVTHDDPVITGKIALAHLNEIPDYYTRLRQMENSAKRGKSILMRGVL